MFVRPDGRLSLPLVGEIAVAGKTVQQLQDHLLAVYEKTVKGAVVTVIVKEIKSRPVYFVGGFAKPGVMQLTGDLTLLQAISIMGGVVPDADGEKGFLLRRDRKIPIDFNRLAQRGDLSQNPKLEPGDSVVVPLAESVYVNGEVKKPGAVKYAGDLTLLKALTQAGGLTPLAAGQPRGHHPRRPREEGSNPGRRRSDHAIAGWQPGRSAAAERHHHGSATTLLADLEPGPPNFPPRGALPWLECARLDMRALNHSPGGLRCPGRPSSRSVSCRDPARSPTLARTLADAGVNITALSAAEVTGRGKIRLLVKNPVEAKRALRKAKYRFSEETAFALRLRNKPGVLARVAARLAKERINVRSIYATTAGRGAAVAVVTVGGNPAKARKVLGR